MKQDIHVVDTSKSPCARLVPVSMDKVKVNGGFWGPRLTTIARTTIPSQHGFLQTSGVIGNFQNAAAGGRFKGLKFNDTDAYKWIEAASYSLLFRRNDELELKLNRLIETIGRAQGKDGYLDTYYSFGNQSERWTDLGTMHELYCAGHLIQAGVAHFRATRKTQLLEIAAKFADHIENVFGPGKRPETAGHPEIEMALVELYRTTNERKYLELAAFFIDQRGHVPLEGLPPDVIINHVPFRELQGMVGHAVRSLYLNCGAADVYLENGDVSLWETLHRLWRNFTTKRMYVTGGAGSRYEKESFGDDYELPNTRAYTESCAAIASFMWNWRMLLATGSSRYADIMELAIYNGVLSGISLDGLSYFYRNPLADRGGYRRSEWLQCACCIPNLSRTLMAWPGCLLGKTQDGIWIHHYSPCSAEVPCGRDIVRIHQLTGYPWEEEIRLEVSVERETAFDLHLRIPGWAEEASVTEGGEDIPYESVDGYAKIRRNWSGKTMLSIRFPMPVQILTSHPHVLGNFGRIALKRGPLIYCLEQTDNPAFDVWDFALAAKPHVRAEYRPELFGGAVALSGTGVAFDHGDYGDALYQPLAGDKQVGRAVEFTAIPYFAWANRSPGPMITWIRNG